MSALFEGVTQKFSFYENPFVAPPKGGSIFFARGVQMKKWGGAKIDP